MSLLFEPTPDGAGRYLDWILSGLGWTLSLALGAWTIALVVGDARWRRAHVAERNPS
jgi:glutamate/aspartate transport system permease protein